MMRNTRAFGQGGLRGADVETSIELSGIASNNFTVEFLRKKNAERGFSRGCRPNNRQQRRISGENCHRKRMDQLRMMRVTNTIAVASRLPRTCWRTIFTAFAKMISQRAGRCYCSFAASIGRLYRKIKRRRISGPENAGGKWSNGFEERIAEIAARSRGSLPDPSSCCGSWFGTLPSRRMLNSRTTLPRSPNCADSGITAYQLRL